jgi:hypothetical protein
MTPVESHSSITFWTCISLARLTARLHANNSVPSASAAKGEKWQAPA